MSEGVSFEDYYDLLEVDSDASREEILRAYREQVRRHHPDVADRRGGADSDEGAARRFKHLSRARAVLTAPARRAEYDRLGHAAYLARHDGGEPLRPDAGEARRDPGTDADGRNAVDGGASADAIDAGTVVEEGGADLADLADRDPLERAWRRFRRLWALRALGIAALSAGALALADAAGPGAALATVTTGAALVVGITGAHAVVTLPRRSEPTPPPASASVGAFAPATVRRARRHARRFLALAVALAVAGGATATHPLAALRSGAPGGWIPAGTLDAPKLVTGVESVASAVLAVSLVTGTLAAVLAVAGGAWLSRHAGYGTGRPYVWESLAVGSAAAAATGVVTAGSAYPGTVPAAGRWLGATGSTPTGGTVALCGLLALAVLVGFSGRVHGRAVSSGDHSVRTDATTS